MKYIRSGEKTVTNIRIKPSVFAILAVTCLVLMSSVLDIGLVYQAHAAEVSCNLQQVSKITASANSTTSPYNAIDNNWRTSWISLGKGSWIKPDLGTEKTICAVDINWYRGGSRLYNFSISVSKDGTSWTDVYSGTNTGTSNALERYEITEIDARWIRITTNGNQWNPQNNIEELRIRGYEVQPTPDPMPSGIVPYRAVVLPYVSVDAQKDAYSNLTPNDMVVLRVGADTTPSSTHLQLVRDLPGQIKGLEFRSISEINNFIQNGNKDKISFIGYVPEPEHGTPQAEIDNIVQSVREASTLIHDAGMKFELVPRYQHNLDHAADFAPYVDYYTVMGQSKQDDGVSVFQSFINTIASNAKKANPNIELMFAELSTERAPSPGLTLQETFKQCTMAVVSKEGSGIVDGGSIWYTTGTVQDVNSYVAWYDTNYGRW